MGRMRENRRAFRFILNKSRAIAANVYLMLYPKALLARMLRESPELLQPVRAALGAIPSEVLTGVGRVYGGSLHKLEPKELAAAPADTVLAVLPEAAAPRPRRLSLSG